MISKVSLNTPTGTHTKLPEILGALFANSSASILGATEEEKAEVSSWLGRIEAGVDSDLKVGPFRRVSRERRLFLWIVDD